MTTKRGADSGQAARERGPDLEDRGAAFHGLLVVDKPIGVTSHDVVSRVRRALRTRGAGHLGTLDPAASGLLLIAVGAATRCAPVWQGGEKTYRGVARFGVVTASQDVTGQVLEQHEVDLDEPRIREASRAFEGDLDQIPPMVSALKVGGERLHSLARRGITVERAPRRIRVVSWEWLSFSIPDAEFRVRCSAGTYVRTLVHDLGRRLGTGAALASLERLRSEPFGLGRAVSWGDLVTLDPDAIWARGGIPLEAALSVLSSVMIDGRGVEEIGRGAPAALGAFPERGASPPIGAGPRSVVLTSQDGRALALGEIESDPHEPRHLVARPHVVFPWAVRTGPLAPAGG